MHAALPKPAGSTKPTVFIGSSSEGLKLAKLVQEALAPCAHAVPWKDVIGKPNHNILDELLTQVGGSDYGVFIFLPDDVITTRGAKHPAVRQNVLFEFGLFVGRLGRTRAAMVVPRMNPPLKPISDLYGVNPLHYDPPPKGAGPEALVKALAEACDHLAEVIGAAGVAERAGIQAFSDMNAAFGDIKERLENGLVVTRAEFIQHSSERAAKLIQPLAARHVDLSVYVQHLKTTEVVCSDLFHRVARQRDLYEPDLKVHGYKGKFEYRYYRAPAALNGFRLMHRDDIVLLALGWYTYLSYDPLTPLTRMKLEGSENPCFVMEPSHPRFADFNGLFDKLIRCHHRQCDRPILAVKDGVCTRNDDWEPVSNDSHPGDPVAATTPVRPGGRVTPTPAKSKGGKNGRPGSKNGK